MKLHTPNLVLVGIFILVLAMISYRATYALFSSSATSENNLFSTAGDFTPVTPPQDITPTDTPATTPTFIPTPSISPSPAITPISNHLVINEVFYDVDTSHLIGDNEALSEWVELFNPTNGPISLTGASITDDNGTCDNLAGTISIPAGSYAIITEATQTQFGNAWAITPSTTVINLSPNSAIGNGLSNTGDTLTIRSNNCLTPGGTLDQISYGVTTNPPAFSPTAIDVADGHSIERDPDGKDNDVATDFIDRSTPTPGT